MIHKSKDTIFALSSPWGMSAISVIRISGQKSLSVLLKLCKRPKLKPRFLYYSNIYDENELVIDKSVIIFFKGPKSFTGEDMIELHVHGGKAVISKILDTLEKISDLRSAEPGEFCKKAFFNRKIGLIEAQGINQLILSETEQQRKAAVDQSFGNLSTVFLEWKKKLLEISAILDAQIEFADEDENIINSTTKKSIKNLIKELINTYNISRSSKQIVDGTNILIFGPPNAGKSSLFNLINQEEKSITTNIEGTTRDLIYSSIDIRGFKTTFVDSAGLREPKDPVEKIGVFKTRGKIKSTGQLMLVLSPDSLNQRNASFLNKTLNKLNNKNIFIVFNKTDLDFEKKQKNNWQKKVPKLMDYPSYTISSLFFKNDHKMYEKFISFIVKHIIKVDNELNENYFFSETRQIEHLKKTITFLKSALNVSYEIELCSEELRLATKELEKINGNIDYENKLDIIFKKFCIGK